MKKKRYCGHCAHFNKLERWCYQLNNHRRPLQAACGEIKPREVPANGE